MKKLWLVPFALFAVGCGNPGDTSNAAVLPDSTGTGTGNETMVPQENAGAGLAGCYGVENGKDTITLQLEVKGTDANGPLSYNYYEKDRNDGMLQAVISGDRIAGFYLFKSEGVMSVRQEVFKIVNGNLVPGYGEVIQRNDSTFFKDPAALKFDETRTLKKRNCTT